MGEKEILVFTLGSSSRGLSIEETLGKRDRNGKSACWELLEHHRLVLSLEESQLQRSGQSLVCFFAGDTWPVGESKPQFFTDSLGEGDSSWRLES